MRLGNPLEPNHSCRMKFTPPTGDMKLWTILWAFMGLRGIGFGVTNGATITTFWSVVQLLGAVGIWVGFPSTKWLLIVFFCCGVIDRLGSLIFSGFYLFWLTGLIFMAFCAVRF